MLQICYQRHHDILSDSQDEPNLAKSLFPSVQPSALFHETLPLYKDF